MAELKLRFNPDTEEVELVVDDEVALASGKEEFKSWVDFYNEKHPVEPPAPEPEPEPSEEDKLRAEVADAQAELVALKQELEAAKQPVEPKQETAPAPEVDKAE